MGTVISPLDFLAVLRDPPQPVHHFIVHCPDMVRTPHQFTISPISLALCHMCKHKKPFTNWFGPSP